MSETPAERDKRFDASGLDAGKRLVRESEELLTLAQEAGRTGIFEWHVQPATMSVSPSFISLYDLEAFDGRYESWLKCIFREDRARVGSLLETAFTAHASNLQMEFRVVCAGNGALKCVEMRCLIFYDADRRATRVVGINVDVTERKQAIARLQALAETLEEAVKARARDLEAENEARKRAEALLRQSQKMEALGQLTGGVAHDLNNLLTVILGGLDIIGRHIPNLGTSPGLTRIARARDMALQGVRRAVALTGRLLAFSRQQPLAPRPIDANHVVAGTCELLRRTLGEAVSLETILAGGLWSAHVDPNQLENALLNLALNGRDAMPNGGKLTIETSNLRLHEADVAALDEPVRPGEYIRIAVADTGTGMEQWILERVFEPFFTTKEPGKGTGLGLSQVREFVRQSGGHVTIESAVGEGTAVMINLPRHAGAAGSSGDAEYRGDEVRAIGAETILVVEDDEAVRAYTTEMLRDLGYQVLAAGDGAAALDIIGRSRDIDLLFTDVVLPGDMTGRELATQAQRRRPRLKVLFTTGYSRLPAARDSRDATGLQVIAKPYSASELSAKVRALLDDRTN